MKPHVPPPPTHLLEGAWTIERAVRNDVARVQTDRGMVRLRTWGLTIRHQEHDVVEVVLYRAALTTTFRPGDVIVGRIVTTWDGDFFRRDAPRAVTRSA